MLLSKKYRFLLSALSGVLMVVSFPYTGSLSFLSFISWVPLLVVENFILNQNYRSGKVFLHAYLTFFIYNVGTTWWIYFASPGGAYFAFILNSLLMALTFYFYHLTRKKYNSKWSLILLVIFWVGFEYLHHHWELSWPWLTLGNIFSRNPELVQWYEYTGALGGSIWILVINYLLYSVVSNWLKAGKVYFKNHSRLIFLVLVIVLVPILLSLLMFSQYEEKVNPAEIVVVQPNIDPYNEKFVSNPESQIQRMLEIAKNHRTSKTKFVLFPETAIVNAFDEKYVDSSKSITLIREFVKENFPIHVFIGASTYAFFNNKNSIASREIPNSNQYIEFYNSSIGIDSLNSQIIHKSKLVLGVEKIPFSKWLPFLEKLSIENGGTSGTLGQEKTPRIISANSLRYAPIVCYESIYGEFIATQVKNGAELLFIITNDGWWRNTPGYKQHNSFASLRAIETRRSIARSANTGISSFINQKGEVIQQTKWWQEAGLVATINRNSEKTIYTKYGDILYRFCSYLAVILVLYSIVIFPIYHLVQTKKGRQIDNP
ncbi:MAG: apolipoprotein N-acyltransferase [Bacteroidota bacterium]